MKKLILAIFALALASCAKEQFSESRVVLPGQELTITATSGDPETRTERASDGSVLWSPGDQISLFYGSGTDGGSCFTAQNTETAKVANFTGTIGVITGGNDVSVEDTYFWATYPYNATASCDGASVTTVLPSEQVATPDTFSDDLFPSIGRSQGLNMAFYNICGGLKFTVSEEGIKSVTLKGNNGEQIAGRITVGFGEDERPAVTGVADGSETITVSAPAGETFEVGRAYYIVLVPTTFESGFTLTFSKGYAEATYERAKKTTIKRSSFGTLTTPDSGLEWTMLYVQIPDENFRAYMVQRFDTNGNGVLDFDEAEAVRRIDVTTDNITSLKGIECCTNLTYLSCSGTGWSSEGKFIYGGLTSLDVTQNTALTHLYCSTNQLTSLDVSQNTLLTDLRCYNNQLTSLDVSQNTALRELYCGSNHLTSLDVCQNTALQSLDCYNNQLTSLDVSKNIALSYLDCSPMNDNQGNNLLDFLYIYQGQAIPNVTENRSSNYIPAGTIIMVAPETGGNEGTGEEDLD